jgi:hypothetical protein
MRPGLAAWSPCKARKAQQRSVLRLIISQSGGTRFAIPPYALVQLKLARQTEMSWSGNPDLLTALCEQAVDAKFGCNGSVVNYRMMSFSRIGQC